MKKIFIFTSLLTLVTPVWAEPTGSNNATQGQKVTPEQQKDLSSTGKDSWAVEMGFKRLDANDDGVISRPEALGQKPLTAGFDQFDKNKDGNLDTAEFAQFSENTSKSVLNDDGAEQRQVEQRSKIGKPESEVQTK